MPHVSSVDWSAHTFTRSTKHKQYGVPISTGAVQYTEASLARRRFLVGSLRPLTIVRHCSEGDSSARANGAWQLSGMTNDPRGAKCHHNRRRHPLMCAAFAATGRSHGARLSVSWSQILTPIHSRSSWHLVPMVQLLANGTALLLAVDGVGRCQRRSFLSAGKLAQNSCSATGSRSCCSSSRCAGIVEPAELISRTHFTHFTNSFHCRQ